ncbi:MAG: 50S ribosomal protein L22 [Microgenomates group bacterium]
MEIKSVQKFVRMSPRKLRLVVSTVKGMKPVEAVEILPHTGKRAAGPLAKVIKTAIANAKQKGINDQDLEFKEIQIGEGPRKIKRYVGGGKGRIRIHKRRMAHIRVILEAKSPKKSKTKTQKLKLQSKTKKKKKLTKGREHGTKN